ncbi:MAG: hypothetical protein NVSMB49_02770 [Ktedonobacteraceae bacterium]
MNNYSFSLILIASTQLGSNMLYKELPVVHVTSVEKIFLHKTHAKRGQHATTTNRLYYIKASETCNTIE